VFDFAHFTDKRFADPSANARLRTFTSVTLGACLVFATCVLGSNFGVKLVNAQSAIQAGHAPLGWFMAGSKPANYQTGVDKTVTENGETSAFLVSSVPVTDGFGTLMQTIRAADYAGSESVYGFRSDRRMWPIGMGSGCG
jgi:hypothetical protein